MANPVVTNQDTQQLELMNCEYKQEIVDFTTAETRTVGQLLGRKLLSDTVAAAADGENTGNGVLNGQLLGSGGPAKVGAYLVTCVEAITNSGRFSLTDPDGLVLTTQIVVPVSGSIHFEGFGLQFDLADGGTDFAADDFFTLTTTADGALDAYNPAGVDGTEIPVALMTRTRTEAVAADYPEGVLIKGEVRKTLVVAATTPTITAVLRDYLDGIGIVLREDKQLLELNNQ